MSFDISPYLHRGEGQHFDRKSLFHGRDGEKGVRDRGKVRDQIAKYVAAFANSEGGVLVLGVEDNGEVTGHRYPADVVRAMLRVPGKRLLPPQASGFVVEAEGRRLLVFNVGASPVPVKVVGGGYPLRIGDQTIRATFEEIQELKLQRLMASRVWGDSRGSVEDIDHEQYLPQHRLRQWRGDDLRRRAANFYTLHEELFDDLEWATDDAP